MTPPKRPNGHDRWRVKPCSWGGIVPGSLTLLGGEPGIGKSTLMLQVSLKLPYKTLYVSGEESQKQIKLRAERIQPLE